jgi:transcriptional regulator with XRE-family HTH domain
MKSRNTDAYGAVIRFLKAARKRAGVTQQQLAHLLFKPQSFVSKYENSERRLDVAEFLMILNALRTDPHAAIDEIRKSAPSLHARIRRRLPSRA